MSSPAGRAATDSAKTSLVPPVPPRLPPAPFAYLRRNLWRSLAVAALLAVIGAGLAAVGFFFWINHHLSAARRAVERGYNLEAIGHLQACNKYRRDEPEVLLLSARVARRSGAWIEAETLL